jgi:hypothetical protein
MYAGCWRTSTGDSWSLCGAQIWVRLAVTMVPDRVPAHAIALMLPDVEIIRPYSPTGSTVVAAELWPGGLQTLAAAASAVASS